MSGECNTCGNNISHTSDLCGICQGKCFNICPSCNLGTKSNAIKNKTTYTKCPNKHVYHAGCIAISAMHESNCLICGHELIDCMTCECEDGINNNLCPTCVSYLKCDCGSARIKVNM